MDEWLPNKKMKLTKYDPEDDDRKDDKSDYRMSGNLKDGTVYTEENHIYFYSEVSKKTMLELNREINKLSTKLLDIKNRFSIKAPPIYLHINSFGGSIFAAMSTVDTIIDCPVDVYTIIEGCAASAGTLISVVGKKRFIRPHSCMLIHQLSTVFWGKMEEFNDEMKNLNLLMTMIKGIYQEYTSVPNKKLDEILKHDIWWDANKCVENGLVDEIMRK